MWTILNYPYMINLQHRFLRDVDCTKKCKKKCFLCCYVLIVAVRSIVQIPFRTDNLEKILIHIFSLPN